MKNTNMQDVFEHMKLFKLSDSQYLYLERNIPTGWLYTLYDSHLHAVSGGDIDQFYITAWDAAQIALKQLQMQSVKLSECHVTLQELLS